VFRGEVPSLPLLLKLCRDDATMWRGRFPDSQRSHIDAWHVCLGGT
jgi:hypothetical protein